MARFRNFAAAGIADVDIELGKDGGEKESESPPLPRQPHKRVSPSATFGEKTLGRKSRVTRKSLQILTVL
jgi:hypothetical protein